jgi:hypothetical protein
LSTAPFAGGQLCQVKRPLAVFSVNSLTPEPVLSLLHLKMDQVDTDIPFNGQILAFYFMRGYESEESVPRIQDFHLYSVILSSPRVGPSYVCLSGQVALRLHSKF